MAAKRSSSSVDDETVEAEDVVEGEVEADLEETSLEEAFDADDEDDDLDADDLVGEGDEDPTELTVPADDGQGEDAGADGGVAAPPEASFDDEDDDGIVAAVAGEDDDDEIEGLREGEFVCRSCYMAKRDTQLADPERLLCRDCA